MAATAFDEMNDRSGNPMILHAMRVSARGKTIDEQIVGALHDLVEDTPITLEKLSEVFPQHIVETVDKLSRRDGETYKEFIKRISEHELATQCKLNDLADNLGRVSNLPPDEGNGLKKRYLQARASLGQTLTEEESAWLKKFLYGLK